MLRFLSKIYRTIAAARNALYDRGVLKSHSLGRKTISVGNLAFGGTGKTPLVALVAEMLADAGETVCILTRGYGREGSGRVLVSDGVSILVDSRTGGDEPVELARKLLGKAIVVADANRVDAAKWVLSKFPVTVFILDDGYQHRRAKRDVDIVCVDAMNTFENVLMRESVGNLRRAHAVVITRSDLIESTDDIRRRIRESNGSALILEGRTEIVGLTPLDDFAGARAGEKAVGWTELLTHGRGDREEKFRMLAFCALGNPEAFFTQLLVLFEDESMNDVFDLCVVKKFPDHHRYTQSDIDSLEEQARESNVHTLLTTAKDAVKLDGLRFEIPCFVVETEVIIDDADGFRALILSP